MERSAYNTADDVVMHVHVCLLDGLQKAFDKAVAWQQQQQQQQEEEVAKHTNAASAKVVCTTQPLPAPACCMQPCVQQQQLMYRHGTDASCWQQTAIRDNRIVAVDMSEHPAQERNQPHLQQPSTCTPCAPVQAELPNCSQQPTVQCHTLLQEPSQLKVVKNSGIPSSVHQQHGLLSQCQEAVDEP